MASDRHRWREDDLSNPGHHWSPDASGEGVSAEGIANIETLVASAGDYVWPSDDLRPRVLETARERAGQRQTLYRLAAMMVAAVLCVMTGLSVSSRLQAMADSAAMPRGERLEQMVGDRVAELGETPDWALAEIVGQWRSDLASRLTDDAGRSPREPRKRPTD